MLCYTPEYICLKYGILQGLASCSKKKLGTVWGLAAKVILIYGKMSFLHVNVGDLGLFCFSSS